MPAPSEGSGAAQADPTPAPAGLRPAALAALQIADPGDKVAATRALRARIDRLPLDPALQIDEPRGLPGHPARPLLVPLTSIATSSMATPAGRAALIHAIAHIEFNAINLALDAIWRFAGLPAAYYHDWLQVAEEEALHFELLRTHLRGLGFDYGDFPAHTGLWDMAERTRGDVLARMGLVPRTLEARGLDASPAVRTKLVSAGDLPAAAIIDRILTDEIGHVRIGNHWYRHVCAERGLDPVAIYPALRRRHEAPRLRGPFNLPARRAAGFTEAELLELTGPLPGAPSAGA